ncbi:2-oxoglutarate oxidoreductase subunit KorA [bioreactor metagenome]|uniref:2-oxoglutarate oxidoreductase subunit KorA n=1 Tax=bioreactor metagenome TaxID=1076179 RepID=A0A644WSE7_9ZZZZ
MALKTEKKFLEGNVAVVEGAIAAGARFYAGYPISPSSEIAETSALELPKYGGLYVQMEDEISSMAALLGASVAGKKVYTATSGPGFSLMQENLGLGIMSEIPAVIVDVQRSGPSTGAATKPAQADIMQSRWGTHGDHSIIAICPSSVQDCFDLTVRAFNLAEKYRTPVVFLLDEIIGHLRETVTVRKLDPSEITDRLQPEEGIEQKDLRTYCYGGCMPAPMPAFGNKKYLSRTTGSTHDEKGEFCPTPENIHQVTHYLTNKIESNHEDIVMTRKYFLEDAQVAFIAFGCSVRSSLAAIAKLRNKGVKVGLLQLVTIWPLPEKEIREVLSSMKKVVIPEMNLGQLAGEIRKFNDYGCKVIQVNRVDGILITPEEIIARLEDNE